MTPEARWLGLAVSEWVQIGVVAATLFLAGFTAMMSKRTREMAEATRVMAMHAEQQTAAIQSEAEAVLEQARRTEAQVDLTRAALQASIRPWLTVKERARPSITGLGKNAYGEPMLDGRGFEVGIGLHNVGSGIALIAPVDGCRIVAHPSTSGESDVRWGKARLSVLAPGESTAIIFLVEHLDLAKFSGAAQGFFGDFWVEVDYTDAEGEQLVTARILAAHLGAQASDLWHIAKIEYHSDRAETPFARVEFSSR